MSKLVSIPYTLVVEIFDEEPYEDGIPSFAVLNSLEDQDAYVQECIENEDYTPVSEDDE